MWKIFSLLQWHGNGFVTFQRFQVYNSHMIIRLALAPSSTTSAPSVDRALPSVDLSDCCFIFFFSEMLLFFYVEG